MTPLLPHFHKKDLMPFEHGVFLYKENAKTKVDTPNETINSSSSRMHLAKKIEAINTTKTNAERLKKNIEKSNQPPSATNSVQDCMKGNKLFKVENLRQKNPIIEKLVEEIATKQGIDDPNNLTPEQSQKLLIAALKLYPERVLKPQLASQPGKFEELSQMLGGFGSEWMGLWNVEAIEQKFSRNGMNALTLGGSAWALTGLFGLDSIMDVTNASAMRKSFLDWRKGALGVGIGLQVAGAPLAQTAGLILKQGTEVWWKTGVTALEFVDKIFSPSEWTSILNGKEAPSSEEILANIPKFSEYLTEPRKSLFNKLYKNETGKSVEVKDEEIEMIARDLVLLSDDIIADPLDQRDDVHKEKLWQRIGLRTMVEIEAFLLANSPNSSYRQKFEDAVNKYLNQKKENNFPKLYTRSLSSKDVPLKGEIEKMIDTKGFNKQFFNLKAQSYLKAMGPQQKKSILETATSHGLSGLIFLTWFMLQRVFMGIQGLFSAGGTLFNKITEKNDDNKKEKDKKKEETLKKLNTQLETDSATICKDKKEWKKFTANILALGIFTKGFGKLNRLNEKNGEKTKLFNVIKEHKDKLDKFALTKIQTSDLKDITLVQKDIADALKGTKAEIKDENIFGIFTKKSGKALKELLKMKTKLKGALQSTADKKADGKGRIRRTASVFKQFTKELLGKDRRKASAILQSLNAPPSTIKAILEGPKKDKAHLDKIVKYLNEVESIYRNNAGKAGKAFFKEVDAQKPGWFASGKKLLASGVKKVANKVTSKKK